MLIFILCLLILCAGIYIYIESTALSVTEYSYTFDRLKVDEFDFVMLSDLHGKDYGNDNGKLKELIDEADPDAIILAGDMITAGGSYKYDPGEYKTTLSLLEYLVKKYPVYYGMGNHEEKIRRESGPYRAKWEGYTKELEKMGIRILQNETVYLEKEGIRLYGLDLEHKYYRKLKEFPLEEGYLKGILGEPDRDEISVLIAHFPDKFPVYAAWGADLVLSGHTHGGIVRLPFLGGVISPQLKLFPKYDSGEFRLKGSAMILSRGAGSHTIPIRINNRAEIVHVKFRKKEPVSPE